MSRCHEDKNVYSEKKKAESANKNLIGQVKDGHF